MQIPLCLIALSATEWQSENKQMRLLPRGIRAQMERTHRQRCGAGRSYGLSRCSDPAWASCIAIFKTHKSQTGQQRPKGGEDETRRTDCARLVI